MTTPMVLAVPKLVPSKKLMTAQSQKVQRRKTWGRMTKAPRRTRQGDGAAGNPAGGEQTDEPRAPAPRSRLFSALAPAYSPPVPRCGPWRLASKVNKIAPAISAHPKYRPNTAAPTNRSSRAITGAKGSAFSLTVISIPSLSFYLFSISCFRLWSNRPQKNDPENSFQGHKSTVYPAHSATIRLLIQLSTASCTGPASL